MGESLSESAGRSCGIHQANQIPIWPVGVGSTQERSRPACQPHWKRTPRRENGDCPSSPRPIVTQLSLSPYVSDALRVTTVPLPDARVSTCMDPLRECLGFLQPFFPPEWSVSPLFFTASCGGSSSQYLYSGLGSLVCVGERGPSLLHGEALWASLSLQF